MTIEEAISVLKNTAWLGTDKKVGDVEKAIMMAVGALKAQGATDTNVGSNGGTISRRAAIDALMEILDRPNHAEFLYTDEICRALGQLPSAEPEIVMCKDCKYAHMTYNGECKYCDIWFPDEKTYMSGDHYCGSAERRTE